MDPPLDEIQWRSPILISMMGGALHADNILWYFQESPFFDRTSNNQVLVSQASVNPNMASILLTRAAFEGRLRTMAGLEFMVAETPTQLAGQETTTAISGGGASMNMFGGGSVPQPGADTAVWVIRKQTRRKRGLGDYGAGDDDDDDDEDGGDEITVHGEYFVVGENIYMAPTLADVLLSRLEHMTSLADAELPLAGKASKWMPSHGHGYKRPRKVATAAGDAKDSQRTRTNTPDASLATAGRQPTFASTASTADSTTTTTTAAASAAAARNKQPSAAAAAASEYTLQRLCEESFQVHMRHGTDYLDQNPITGRPGDFHLSTTARAAAAKAAAAQAQAQAALAAQNKAASGLGGIGKAGLAIDTKAAASASAGAGGDDSAISGSASASGRKDGSKTPKTPTAGGRLKRRKSRVSNAGAA